MEPWLFFRGVAIGFSIAAPVGPIGVLCIRRSLAEEMSYGFVSGLGAATADAIYVCVAGFGLTAVSDILTGQQTWLSIIGGAFLIYLGISSIKNAPAEKAAQVRGYNLIAAYSSTFLLTLVNPMTIASFALVFAALGVGARGSGYVSAAVLVAGVFLGSALWWLILSGSVSLFKTRFNSRGLRLVNVAAGAVLLAFGSAVLIGNTPAARDLTVVKQFLR